MGIPSQRQQPRLDFGETVISWLSRGEPKRNAKWWELWASDWTHRIQGHYRRPLQERRRQLEPPLGRAKQSERHKDHS
jgi:hypothetical protein